MLNSLKNIYHCNGIKGIWFAVSKRLYSRRARSYSQCRDTLFGSDLTGLEIGGPSGIFSKNGVLPLYSLLPTLDNCNFSNNTMWEGEIESGDTFRHNNHTGPNTQYIAEASQLDSIPDGKYDYFLSSHVLEHLSNPLKALKEWMRILREEGHLLLVLPHKDGTFDHRRPPTTLEHMIDDYNANTKEDDLTHLKEILQLHDLSRDAEAGSFEAFKERSEDNFNNRGMHHHVFTTRSAIELIDHAGLQIITVEAMLMNNIIILAKKVSSSEKTQNNAFLNEKLTLTRSPFKSDHTMN